MVLRFPLVTETFVLRELNAVADRLAFPGRAICTAAGPRQHHALDGNSWLPVVQTASIARGCGELLRLTVTRPRAVARVIGDVLSDYARDPGELVHGLAAVVLAASSRSSDSAAPASLTSTRISQPNPLKRRGHSPHLPT